MSIRFSKKRQTRDYWNQKRSRRAESTVFCGDFGTYASAQLPIRFENGPMQVENSIFISAKERCAVKCKGMQRNCNEMQRNCVASLLGGNANRILNLHRTVLEAYWKLGAGIGTKITATNCTFSSFASFFVSALPDLSFFRKTNWNCLQKRTLITSQFRGGRGESSEMQNKKR